MAFFNRRRPVSVEIRNYEEEPPRRSWLRDHLVPVLIVGVVVLVAAVGAVLYGFLQQNSPVNRFLSASAKDLDTSFSFDLNVSYNDETAMRYTGAMHTDLDHNAVFAKVDAEYPEYTFTNAVVTDAGLSYLGNYYSGQWTVSDCSASVLDFIDFYTDYRRGEFDAAAFLRFFDLTSKYSSEEFGNMIQTLSSTFASSNDISNLRVSATAAGTEYDYTPDMYALLNLISSEGGPVFFKASEYETFSQKVRINEATLRAATGRMRFVIDADGYLREVHLSLSVEDETFALDLLLSGFGASKPAIPDDFYTAASLSVPES